MSAPVSEIFSSAQGEGPFVGVRQVFVRTYGCDLACRYCDTEASRTATGPCRVEMPPGSGDWQEVENPIGLSRVWDFVCELDEPPGLHHSVSFTGGEPLLHVGFVRELAALCHGRGLRTYLETNGQRSEALRAVVDVIDTVAMDAKLPSGQAAEGLAPDLVARSVEFLHVARATDVFAKIVITPEVTAEELEPVAAALATAHPEVTLVLQPVTPRREVRDAPTAAQMLALQAAVARHLRDTRVIPQCHVAMGQL